MRKRVQIALAVLVVAIAGVVAWQVLREREPVYQGRRLSVWLEEGYADGSFNAQTEQKAKRRTDEAVRQIGTNAIPVLMRKLLAKDSTLRIWAMTIARKQRVIEVHFTPARIRRLQGCLGLEALDAEAHKVATAELVKCLNELDPAGRRDAVRAIRNIDPEAAAQAGVK